nr:hypothetical protein [Micromonospora sp. DSM 115978]
YSSFSQDPQRLADAVAATPFTPGDAAFNEYLLRIFDTTPTGTATSVVALLDPDGTTSVSRPAGQAVPVEDLGAAWQAALAGEAGWTDVFDYQGRPQHAVLSPVGGTETEAPWAVLVAVTPDDAGQRFEERLGSLGHSEGGLSDVDRRGVAAMSWNPALIGTQVVDPARLDDVPAGVVQDWT